MFGNLIVAACLCGLTFYFVPELFSLGVGVSGFLIVWGFVKWAIFETNAEEEAVRQKNKSGA